MALVDRAGVRIIALAFAIGLVPVLARTRAAPPEPSVSSTPAPGGLPLAVHEDVLARLEGTAKQVPAAATALKLGHLVDDAALPELAFTELRERGGHWVACRNVWGQETFFEKGQIVNGVQILDVSRDRVVCKARGKHWPVFARPGPPPIACTDIVKSGPDWTAQVEVKSEQRSCRMGDTVHGARVVELTQDKVVFEYLGVRGDFPRFPVILCRVTRRAPEGLTVYAQDTDRLRLLCRGDLFRGAKLIDVQPYHASFEYRGQAREFPAEPLPEVACAGTMEVEGVLAALIVGEGGGARKQGELLGCGARIDRIERREPPLPTLVHLSFHGVPFEVAVGRR